MSCDHLLSEQIGQQHGGVALRAVATDAYGTVKQVAVRATPLTEETFGTTRAFVDRLGLCDATPLELQAKPLQIWQAGVPPQAKGALLMGARAIPCTR